MTRDVVRIRTDMPAKMFKRLPKNKDATVQILDPRLIALPHIRMILIFDEKHEMFVDYDYDENTQLIHASNDSFSCDFESFIREDGAVKCDVHNAKFQDEEVRKWFYMVSNRYKSHITGKETTTTNYYGIWMHYLALQNYICYFGIENVFDVVEKVAKKPSNKHKSGNRKKNNSVRLYKLYTLRKDWESAKRLKKPIQYTCTAWTQRGHMRHCKSGKITYVRPCVKGKDREKFVGKEYLLTPHKRKV